jgi:hypothetical protein
MSHLEHFAMLDGTGATRTRAVAAQVDASSLSRVLVQLGADLRAAFLARLAAWRASWEARGETHAARLQSVARDAWAWLRANGVTILFCIAIVVLIVAIFSSTSVYVPPPPGSPLDMPFILVMT